MKKQASRMPSGGHFASMEGKHPRKTSGAAAGLSWRYKGIRAKKAPAMDSQGMKKAGEEIPGLV